MSSQDWEDTSIGQQARILHGWTFKSEYFAEALEPTIPIVVSIGNFKYTGGFRFATTEVTGYEGKYPAQYILSPSDIVMVMTCQTPGGEILGIPAKVPDDGRTYLHNQRIGKIVLQPGASVSLDYLYWVFLLPSFNRELFRSATGTKVLHTAPERIARYKFRYPSPSLQGSIAEFLWNLEAAIAACERELVSLESLAEAVFKSWFVDMSPIPEAVQVMIDGHEGGNKVNLAPVAGLPPGWRRSTVGAEFKVMMGQSPPGSSYNLEKRGLPFFQGRTDFEFRFPLPRVFCDAPTRIAKAGDTLVSVRAPVGDCNMASVECAVGRGVAGVRHNSGSRSFTYYAMRELRDDFDMFNGAGTVFGSISKAQFNRAPFMAAPEALVGAFERFAAPIDERIAFLTQKMSTMYDLQKALIPALLHGRVPVRVAEKRLAEA